MSDGAPGTALVTGGTRGIGAAVASWLVARGWTVLACYMRNRKAAAATADSLAGGPGRFEAIKGNVARQDQLDTLVSRVAEEVAESGGLDALVLNAASGILKPLADNTRKHWDWTMDINAWAPLRLAQMVRPFLGAGSSVVAISSPGAVRAIPDYGAVGISKAALEAMARQLAYEWGPDGIRVNAVRPGLVPTGALEHFPDRTGLERQILDRTPLGRLVQPEDVAEVVGFLLSSGAGAITGTTIEVDAGASLEA